MGMSNGDTVVIDMDIIKSIESGGNPYAISSVGARGLYQIMPITLREFNNFNETSYTVDDLFNSEINSNIANWYMFERIPQMLRHFKKPVTLRNILWAYNAGIGNVVKDRMPDQTKNYIQKYERLSNEGST